MITIAVPTGRLGKTIFTKFINLNMIDEQDISSRLLDITNKDQTFRFLLVKPSDVITYVENGVCDLGIVGKDTLSEEQSNVYELLDLQTGICDFAIAGLPQAITNPQDRALRVATKYPNVAKAYYKTKNQDIDIIKLNGSVELAPLVGLSDVILDIVETGSTLKANGLVIIEKIQEISARLIANQVSYRFKNKEINDLIKKLEEIL